VAVTDFDPDRARAFDERMSHTLNESFLAMMISIGHQTGLFDTMADLSPSTSGQIADASGLDERYVREWLGAMVTGGIATFDPREPATGRRRCSGWRAWARWSRAWSRPSAMGAACTTGPSSASTGS
jgi:hypothetical protein